jgi:hypothetical protein
MEGVGGITNIFICAHVKRSLRRSSKFQKHIFAMYLSFCAARPVVS